MKTEQNWNFKEHEGAAKAQLPTPLFTYVA